MELWTIRETALELSTTEATVRGLVRAHGLPIHPVPRSPNAKGLTMESVEVIRKALGGTTPKRATVSA